MILVKKMFFTFPQSYLFRICSSIFMAHAHDVGGVVFFLCGVRLSG